MTAKLSLKHPEIIKILKLLVILIGYKVWSFSSQVFIMLKKMKFFNYDNIMITSEYPKRSFLPQKNASRYKFHESNALLQ